MEYIMLFFTLQSATGISPIAQVAIEAVQTGILSTVLYQGLKVVWKKFEAKDSVVEALHKNYQDKIEKIYEGQRQDIRDGNSLINSFEKVLERLSGLISEMSDTVDGNDRILQKMQTELSTIKRLFIEYKNATTTKASE